MCMISVKKCVENSLYLRERKFYQAMLRILNNLFKKKEKVKDRPKKNHPTKKLHHTAIRKGEIGEYKIDIQLSQFPKNYKFLHDIMIENPKSISGYTQIDHLIITSYGIFVIETKNYQGTIYGGKKRKTWLVNGKFKMMNPLFQNYGHIQAIKHLLNNKYKDLFTSLITFTKRCTLKVGDDIRHISSDEMVIYDFHLTETINRKISIAKLKYKAPLLTDSDIEEIYNTISSANISDPAKRQKHIQNIKRRRQSNHTSRSNSTCAICNESVSKKVKDYCLNNKKRFNGKIYCYDHQREI